MPAVTAKKQKNTPILIGLISKERNQKFKTNLMKPKLLLPFISLIGAIFISCNNSLKNDAFLRQPKKVNTVIDQYVSNGSFPFLYMRMENKAGEVIYEYQAVNDSLLPNTKIDGDTWFRIWSMSKIITISLMLDLVEDGIIDLNDRITDFIPEFKNLKVAVDANGKSLVSIANDYYKEAGFGSGLYENNPFLSEQNCPLQLIDNTNPITVEHLINHQAGFYYATTPFICLNQLVDSLDLNSLNTNEEVIKNMAQLPLIMVPGSNDFYGTNTPVLGFVAERASGKTLAELLEERIKKPMNIKGLRYKKSANINLLPTFSGKDGKLRKVNQGELDIMGAHTIDYRPESKTYFGGEGMIGTANGYADFLRMLLNHGTLNGHRFLEEATVQQMYAPHTQLDNEWGYNGYNLWVSSAKDLEMGYGDEGLWRGGGYEQTHFWVDPKRDFVAVIMSQMFAVPEAGYNRDNRIRGAVYKQLLAPSSQTKN
jgi:CubicO group peptidase (beta-lactamase class C family)